MLLIRAKRFPQRVYVITISSKVKARLLQQFLPDNFYVANIFDCVDETANNFRNFKIVLTPLRSIFLNVAKGASYHARNISPMLLIMLITIR